MTKLSINLNKIALLRNSRGRNFPNVMAFAKKFILLGADGITVHPREDERHITRQDCIDLGRLLESSDVEFNIEGYPSHTFLELVEQIKPTQVTLVPDSPEQLTSDHGWDLVKDGVFVKDICEQISTFGVRTAIFLEPDMEQIKLAPSTNVERIELYTETYASSYETTKKESVWEQFNQAAIEAQRLGLGVNAGHDLALLNLAKFLEIKNILEISIGHVLTIECIELGMESVMRQYVEIVQHSNHIASV